MRCPCRLNSDSISFIFKGLPAFSKKPRISLRPGIGCLYGLAFFRDVFFLDFLGKQATPVISFD
jgi:hypothetical protein